MKIALTNRESDVMKVLWADGPSAVAEVQRRLEDRLAYTTVLTVLRILEDKGYVGHVGEGKGYRYHALVEEQAAQRSAVAHLAEKLFRGSAELLMIRLVEDQSISDSQRKRLRKLLAEAPSPSRPKRGSK